MLANITNLAGHNVRFHRFNESREVIRNGQTVTIQQKKTRCTIWNKNDDQVIAEEEVGLHNGDADSRPLGRQYAFKKAMKNTNLSKKERVDIWNDYLVQSGIKEDNTRKIFA